MSDQNESSPDHATHDHDHHPAWGRGFPGRRPFARPLFLLVFAVVIAGIAFTGESLGHSHGVAGATITVTGSGTVTGTPDTMSFQIGVQSVAYSATAALADNNAKMYALQHSLLGNGVKKKDMQTTGLNIYQNTNSSGTVTGFTVVDNLNVTTHDTKKAGGVIDAAAHAVGNGIQFNGVTFSISNQSSLLAAARARAIKNAHVEATQIAKGAGTTVGSIVRVTDQENTGSTGVYYPGAYKAFNATASVPIQAGSQSINVQVSVVYSLNN